MKPLRIYIIVVLFIINEWMYVFAWQANNAISPGQVIIADHYNYCN